MFSSMPVHTVQLSDGTSFIIDPKNFEPTAHWKLSFFSPKIEPPALPPPLPLTRSIGYDDLTRIRRGSDALDKIAEQFNENISIELRELLSYLTDFEHNKRPTKFQFSEKHQIASNLQPAQKFIAEKFEEKCIDLPLDAHFRLKRLNSVSNFLLKNSMLLLPLVSIVLDYLKEEEELPGPPKLTRDRSFTK